jgi:hypothetical protein
VVTLPAHLVATPVLERLAGDRSGGGPEGPTGELQGAVLGAGATAAWVEVGGFVVAITTREVPLLPNAIALSAGSGALFHPGVAAGATARLSLGRVALGALQVTWDPVMPPSWDPTVPAPLDPPPAAVATRAAALLHALGIHPTPSEGADPDSLVGELARIGLPTAVDPGGGAGLRLLFRGVRERDPVPALAGARELLGRGQGLTPEGDDLLAAVAGTLAVLGPAAGLDGPARDELLAALAPGPGRTTALSATLLALASVRRLPEPAGRLLDLGPAGEAAWPEALARLERLGHGSGRAYAAGIAATASLLAAPHG